MEFRFYQCLNNKIDFVKTFEFLNEIDQYYTPPISQLVDLKLYTEKLLKNGKVFLLKNTEDVSIGILALYVNDYVQKRAFISSIGLLPPFQKLGLGKKILEKAIEVAKENTMESISLEVNSQNSVAINFYHKNGFVEESNDGDIIKMVKELIQDYDNNIPVVSICCITYNHADFIRDAMDGFLMQKTDFPFEILIHDDASTDGTKEIIIEYAKKYPELIFPILQSENQYSRGIRSMNVNFNFPRAKGKYIALCEGDDYWTDPFKLQKQADFLEANKDYVMVADNSIWHEISSNNQWNFSDKPERDIIDIEMLEKRQFATAAVLFRNSLEFKNKLDKIIGDTVLWIFLSTLGKIRYKTEVTSVYRRHQSGVVLGTDRLEWAKNMENWNQKIKEIAPHIPNCIFRERNFGEYKSALEYYFKTKNLKNYKKSLIKCMSLDFRRSFFLVIKHTKYLFK